MTGPIVEMRGIDREFRPGQGAERRPSEAHARRGARSRRRQLAGKSTLMKILTGAYHRDAGEVTVGGEPVRFRSPHESRDLGIDDLPGLRPLRKSRRRAERLPRTLAAAVRNFRRPRHMHPRDARTILDRLRVDVNSVYQKVESLSGGRQQSVAIARAISFEPEVVIFDEPTANLSVTPQTNRLLETIHGAEASSCVPQIIISHRPDRHFRGRRPRDGAEARPTTWATAPSPRPPKGRFWS